MVLRESNMFAQPDYGNISPGGNAGNNSHLRHHHPQQRPHTQPQQPQHHHHQHQHYIMAKNASVSPQQQQHQHIVNKQHAKKLYAKAVYENIAESPDELAFKRGDILTVIEQDTDGLTGWWLCSLRDRTGICPGNRLKIVPTPFDPAAIPSPQCYTPSPLSSPCPSALGTPGAVYTNGSISSSASYQHQQQHPTNDLYENTAQKHSKRRSWHIMPNKVVTPQKCGDVYWYDLLPGSTTPTSSQRSSSCSHSTTISSLSSASSTGGGQYINHQQPHQSYPYQNLPVIMADQPQDTYDTPKPAVHIGWIRQPSAAARADDSYDIPRPSPGLLSQHNITPSSSNSSLLTATSDSLSLSSSNRSSMANMPDYDVPRRHPMAAVAAANAHQTPNRSTAIEQAHITYDVPQLAAAQTTVAKSKELPLELSSALETLSKLQNEATSAVTRLLGFISPAC